MKTLNFLSDFWHKAKQAVDEIETELPKVAKEDILKPIGNKMWIVQYKDLGNSWNPKDLLMIHSGESNNLTLLVDKVKSVFQKSPDKVVDFLQGTLKKGYFLNKMTEEKIVLTPNELMRLELYINENI